MHLAKSHREVWNLRKSRIELICKTQKADITVPCSLCVLKVTWSLARSSSSRSSLPYCRMAAADAIFFMHLQCDGLGSDQQKGDATHCAFWMLK